MPFVLEFLAIGLRVCYDIVSYFTNKFAWNFMVRLAEFQSKAREESFDKLMKTLIQPFTESEVNVAKFQYSMLLSRAETLLEEDSDCQQSLKSLIYRICTSSKLYTGCELAISVMLLNLGSSTSECGMESLISSLKDNNSVDRPITLPQLHKELLIRKNGPARYNHQVPT